MVTGPVIVVNGSTAADLEQYKGKLKGAFVLPGEPSTVETDFNPGPMRMSQDRFKENETSWPNGSPTGNQREQMMRMMRAFQFRSALARFAKEEGAAAMIVDSGHSDGLLNAGAYGPGRDPKQPQTLPQVTMIHEHYGTLYRLVERGEHVKLEMQVTNYFEDLENNACNVVGDIPGTTKPDEYVILGAHLDSWDLGTGATDNGAGSMAVLEAARLLKAAGVKPERTIRFILFGGEEEGLLGSRAYVNAHKDLMPKISGMFALDTGTGRVRGVGTQGNQAVIPVFEKILEPLKPLGVWYVNERTQIGTDHLSFEGSGVPGFAFFQDAVEYKERTHHTQIDTLDKIIPDDLEEGAVTMAVMASSVADLPNLLARKNQEHSAAH
ncbi:MAG: M20/M25/M40 family metallo-hydrolase, partial [Blastocatellia bacterium]